MFVGYTPPVGSDQIPSYIYMSREAAAYLAALPVKAVSTDAWSIKSAERMYDQMAAKASGYEALAPVHRASPSRSIPVFEHLDAPLGEANVMLGFPLKIKNGDASPVRAAALVY